MAQPEGERVLLPGILGNLRIGKGSLRPVPAEGGELSEVVYFLLLGAVIGVVPEQELVLFARAHASLFVL